MKEQNKFKVGMTYEMGWIGDSDLISLYTVAKRTEKTVTLQSRGSDEKTFRISIYQNTEEVSPTGKYSMSPVLKASKVRIDDAMVDNVKIGGLDPSDAPDFVDAYIESADYNGQPMTGNEIDCLGSTFIYEKLIEQIY